jgi:hypothetical protein
MARIFSRSWVFVVRRCLSTFPFSFTSTPIITLISARISARARPPITPTGSPDARYARAHPHELRTPTHAPSRHRYPVSTSAHTLSARNTPHVRPSCAGSRQAHASTHARPRSTRRTELDDEGSAGRCFGSVCRRFRVYKHPHLYTHPPAIHPRVHPSFPRQPQPSPSPQSPARVRPSHPCPRNHQHHQQPAAQPLPLPFLILKTPSRTTQDLTERSALVGEALPVRQARAYDSRPRSQVSTHSHFGLQYTARSNVPHEAQQPLNTSPPSHHRVAPARRFWQLR